MRLGCQTLIFGPRFESRRSALRALDMIAAFGFEGVEFAQAPLTECLGFKSIDDLRRECEDRGLTVLGFSGGSLRERIRFLGSFKEPYLYADRFDCNILRALDQEYRIALHPHAYCEIGRLADTRKLLQNHPGLWLLPDTAHAAVMGEDIAPVVRTMCERIAAVHFKDWTPLYGRSSYRYASGFRELGQGELNLRAIWEVAAESLPSGWAVWELDRPSKTINESFQVSTSWLARVRRSPLPAGAGIEFPTPDWHAHGDFARVQARSALYFSSLARVPEAYSHVCEAIADSRQAPAVKIFAVHRSSSTGRELGGFGEKLLALDTFYSEAVAARVPSHSPQYAITAVPLLDPNNPHFVHYLVAYSGQCQFSFEDDYSLGTRVALTLLNALRYTAWDLSTFISALGSRFQEVKDFCKQLANLIAEVLGGDSVAIYRAALGDDRLITATKSGWEKRSRNLRSDIGLVRREFRNPNGNVIAVAVARTRGGMSRRNGSMLDDDAEYLLDTITHAAAMNLTYLLGKAERDRLRESHLHSIRQPLLEIRGKVDELGEKIRHSNIRLPHDFLGDIVSYVSLVSQRCDEPSGTLSKLPTAQTPIRLVQDVLASTIRQLDKVLRQRKFSRFNIDYSGLSGLSMMVDRGDFQRIFFNLLGNSIKYAFRDPTQFEVVIDTELTNDHVEITVADFGAGVADEDIPFIFERGYRSSSVTHTTPGQGVGLWFVRQLVLKYGGTVTLQNPRLPTLFCIALPLGLVAPTTDARNSSA